MGTTEILVSGGVAAILASVAGGGLKAFGVELPLLASVRRQSLLLLVGAILIALGLFAPGLSGPGDSGADASSSEALARAEPVTVGATDALSPARARPEIPNIHELPLAAARQFLMQNGWAPITSASSPMANDRLGLRQEEVFETGFLEAVSCSGASLAPCMFRYRNPQGFVLEVVSVGEDMRQAIVNSATILDCTERPQPDGCN